MAYTEREASVGGYASFASGMIDGYGAAMRNKYALQIQAIELRINKMFADAQFKRQMTSHFQSQRDLESQVTQASTKNDIAYKTRLASSRVGQAEGGITGNSAVADVNSLTKSALGVESIIVGNFSKAKRAKVYELSAIKEARSAQSWGFARQEIAIQAGLSLPPWLSMLGGSVDSALTGMSVYNQMGGGQGQGGGADLGDGDGSGAGD